MSEDNTLTAQARDRVGKGAARELRRNNMVPAVIYGDKKDPLSIALPRKETTLAIHAGGFMTTLLDIEVDGKKHKVLPKDYQLHPVSDVVMHVDLLRVSAKTAVTVEIPVVFLNEEECIGLKAGGTLNVVRFTVEVNCPANSIPDNFEIDLTSYDIGDSVNISAVDMPEGAEPTITDRDFTIATIATPAGLKSDEDADGDDEPVETEVINQKADSVMGEGEDGLKDKS
ncbi:50S ribosomal protein L25/general stress protein Ctc [Ahrensia sp. R2A130]|uniref:50S ribosomal protein L25/general stress protein Ctc n=1 Tax=Ahrensia sp. R2A130 TaxID=744979 RepID=UPI0001E0836D|nr:50S ribosomal protein L25/general stress protein Ctc [Ahrensia sp. R2A130]EFL91009.1 ribosomal protein L25, Ctc-form [Ahrensia sp. R2A130]